MLGIFPQNFDFAHPAFFLLLLLLPLYAAIWYFKGNKKQNRLLLPNADGHETSIRAKFIWLLPLLKTLGFITLVMAIARPQLALKEEEIEAEGIDISLAIDLSSSMFAQDFQPNRLEVSKLVASDFVDKRKYDRIGLTIFAGEAITQCPLTTDHAILKKFLSEIGCGLLQDGTAIGMGLATSINRLKDSKAKTKIVILLTDGVNNAGYLDPMVASEIAVEFGVKVYTIGVGSRGRARAPVRALRDCEFYYGMTTVQIDENLLRQISKKTGGQYYRATSAEALQQIYDEIDKLEKTKIEITTINRNSEEYYRFLIWAVGFFLLELVLRNTLLRSFP